MHMAEEHVSNRTEVDGMDMAEEHLSNQTEVDGMDMEGNDM
jgi:hypothetical protein